MDYKKFGEKIYVRIDKDEEIIEKVMEVCKKENIQTAIFDGIGACGAVTVSTYLPEVGDFTHHTVEGMLELVSLCGNITLDNDGEIFQHCHALFSYLDENGHTAVLAGHLKEALISYTGEITITPANGVIGRMFDEKSGITVWDFDSENK